MELTHSPRACRWPTWGCRAPGQTGIGFKISKFYRSESDRSVGVYKSKFLARLMRCAGHMHSLGMTVNICVTTRGIFTGKKNIELARS